MRLELRLQREIARLHFYNPASSDRVIANTTGVSPSTVGPLRKLLCDQPLGWVALKDLDDDAWQNALGTHNRSIAVSKPAPDWAWLHEQMQRPDATLNQLWLEWKEQNPEGVGYTQFTSGYRNHTKKLHIVMRRVHRPGEKLFVDFAGRVIPIRDAQGHKVQYAQIFVAVLGYSNYTFAYAVPSQTTADWVSCHVQCFEFLGGAPEWVVCDNLKAAVIRRARDRVVINATYLECLRYYDTASAPTRARKPKDKAKAEVGVQIVQRLLFRLRDRVFSSFEELNEALRELTDKLNGHKLVKQDHSRRKRFDERERSELKSLPAKPFELCEWRYDVLVGQDYHVGHERSYYSVPCQLVGRRVDLRSMAAMLEIFHSNRRVALHALISEANASSTLPEHRPLAHQKVLEGEPRELMQWASSVGDKAREMIDYHLTERRDRANGLRAAKRMRELTGKYGEARFEQVCTYALKAKVYALDKIESIFKRRPDLQPRDAKPHGRPTHENVRGGQYFGDQS